MKLEPKQVPEVKLKLKPLPGRVAIRLVSREDERIGKLIIPGEKRQGVNIGDVVSIGDPEVMNGSKKQPLINLGDRVMLPDYAGHQIRVGKDMCVVCLQAEIVAVIEQTPEDLVPEDTDKTLN